MTDEFAHSMLLYELLKLALTALAIGALLLYWRRKDQKRKPRL